MRMRTVIAEVECMISNGVRVDALFLVVDLLAIAWCERGGTAKLWSMV